jgi:hypothetical protein
MQEQNSDPLFDFDEAAEYISLKGGHRSLRSLLCKPKRAEYQWLKAHITPIGRNRRLRRSVLDDFIKLCEEGMKSCTN